MLKIYQFLDTLSDLHRYFSIIISLVEGINQTLNLRTLFAQTIKNREFAKKRQTLEALRRHRFAFLDSLLRNMTVAFIYEVKLSVVLVGPLETILVTLVVFSLPDLLKFILNESLVIHVLIDLLVGLKPIVIHFLIYF